MIEITALHDFFLHHSWLLKLIYSAITLIISALLYRVILRATEKAMGSKKILTGKKSNTYIKFVRSIIRYVFAVIVVLTLLKIYGVNISSMLAGVGLIGVVLGLAVQDLLKDVIRGSGILSDEYFSVGDVVEFKGIEGKVIDIGLKTTKIQELTTGNVHSIANRNIEHIAVVAPYIYVRVPLPYELKVEEQRAVVDKIVENVKTDEIVEDCENIGLAELADSRIEYLLKIKIDPHNKLQSRRNTLGHIVETLEKSGVSVPYNQLDIHQK